MKISPVAGTPVISQPSATGLSPERLQRIKMMVSGKEPHEEKVELDEKVPTATKSIKLQVNKTPEAVAAPQENPIIPLTEAESTQQSVISDTDVQTKPEPEAIQQVSPQVAALARQKRLLDVREKNLAEREKALEANQGQSGLSRAELEQKVKNRQALSVLEDLGITYDQLTEELLGRQNAPDLSSFEEKILKKVEEKLSSKDAAQEQAVFEHMSKNVKLMTLGEDYPFVKAWKAQDKVMDLIKRAWKEDGEVIDEDEALNLIEAELKEESKVFKPLLKEPEQTTQAAAEQQPKSQGVKTLTNKDSARPATTRRQRAIAAALGQK